MSTERQWWPEHCLDEICPAGRPDPNAWIRGRIKTGPCAGLYAIDGFEQYADKAEGQMQAKPGDVMNFYWCEDRGEVELTLTEGGYDIKGDIPDDVTTFWLRGDNESVVDTLDELVAIVREWNSMSGVEGPFDDGPCCVAMAHWSGAIPFRLVEEGMYGPDFQRLPMPAPTIDDDAMGAA